jgi:predicted phosphodiesterase
MSEPTIKGEICKDYLTEFSDLPTLTLAKMIYKQNPSVFKDVKQVNRLLQYYRGVSGERDRGRAERGGSLMPHKGTYCPYDSLPEGLTCYSDWSQYRIEGKSILVLSDLHSPYHDKKALEIALRFGEDKSIDTILFNGDSIDFFSLSFWEKDPRERNFQNELNTFQAILGIVRELYPNAHLIMKIGNHEERLERYMKVKAPELLGYKYLDYEKLVDPESKFNIEIVRDKRIMRVGHLNIVHGHEFGKGMFSPVNPARGLYLRGKEIAMCGHHHRTSQHTETSMTGEIISCWSTGCLSDLHPDYLPINKWNHGFAWVRNDGEGFHVENKKIINGKVY